MFALRSLFRYNQVIEQTQTELQKPSSNQEIAEQQIRVRPIRVAARRQRELLCVMEIQELEWHDIDDVDVDIGEDAMQNVADVHYGIETPVFEDEIGDWANL